MCPCVVSVVMWSSLVCLWDCRGTLCEFGGCCGCDACTIVCVRECDGTRLTAMLVWGMDEVWWLEGMWMVHVVQVLCLAQLTWYGRVWCVGCEQLVELVEYMRCVWVWLGVVLVERGWVDERIVFELYQSCGNRGSVGRVSVFWLQWCGWCGWWVGRGLRSGSGGLGWCCESGLYV